MNDLRHALRALLRAPGFTAVSVLTLALAIGACTAIYTVVYSVLLKPLPYPEPERIVQVWQLNQNGTQNQFSHPNFVDVRDSAQMLGPVAQYQQGNNMILAGDQPLRVLQTRVSQEFLDVFRTAPVVGRRFAGDELRENAPGVALISHKLWQSAFGGNTDLHSLRIRVSGQPYTIVGVLPASFDFPLNTDIWVPREQGAPSPYRTGHNWQVVARLADGATLEGARGEVSALAKRLKAEFGDQTQMSDAALVPLAEQLTGPVSNRLVVLLAAVATLLLIACANLVNLLLVRVASRGRELAVRAALGAGRVSLAAPFVSESLILAVTGGALGIVCANLMLRALLALDPGNLPRTSEIGLSAPVLFFAIAVTFATAIVLALAAAWRALRPEIADSLRSASRGQAGGAAVSRVRSGLIVAQLACSIVLLIGAGLLARSMAALLSQNVGFRTEQVLAIEISSTAASTDDQAALASLASFHERYLEKLRTLPGVQHVGGINRLPLTGGYANGGYIKVRGDEDWSKGFDLMRVLARDPSRAGQAEFRVASAGYFQTMDIPLLRGRLFNQGDVASAPHVAVVSEAFAKSWQGDDVIGRRIQFGNMDGDLREFTIVGVVGDVRERGLDAAARPVVYADYRQRPLHTYNFAAVVRGSVDPSSLTNAARIALRELNPEMAPRIRAVEQIFATAVADRRFTLIVVGAFAGAALLLAVLGIYGVLSYVVSQRTREFGVRMALGAQRADVWRMILRQAFLLVAIGSAIGVVASLMLTRLMRTLLFEVTPADPVTFAGVILTLAAAAFVACQMPAIRATRVNPTEALRAE